METVTSKMCIDAIKGPLSTILRYGLEHPNCDISMKEFRSKYPEFNFVVYYHRDGTEDNDERYLQLLKLIESYIINNDFNVKLEYENKSILEHLFDAILIKDQPIILNSFGIGRVIYFGQGCCSLHELIITCMNKGIEYTPEIISSLIGTEDEAKNAGEIKLDYEYSYHELDSFIIKNRGFIIACLYEDIKDKLSEVFPEWDDIYLYEMEYYEDNEIKGKEFYIGFLKYSISYYIRYV